MSFLNQCLKDEYIGICSAENDHSHTEWAELCRGPEKQILPLPSDHPYVGTAEALHVTLIALIYCVGFHGLQKRQAFFFSFLLHSFFNEFSF